MALSLPSAVQPRACSPLLSHAPWVLLEVKLVHTYSVLNECLCPGQTQGQGACLRLEAEPTARGTSAGPFGLQGHFAAPDPEQDPPAEALGWVARASIPSR